MSEFEALELLLREPCLRGIYFGDVGGVKINQNVDGSNDEPGPDGAHRLGCSIPESYLTALLVITQVMNIVEERRRSDPKGLWSSTRQTPVPKFILIGESKVNEAIKAFRSLNDGRQPSDSECVHVPIASAASESESDPPTGTASKIRRLDGAGPSVSDSRPADIDRESESGATFTSWDELDNTMEAQMERNRRTARGHPDIEVAKHFSDLRGCTHLAIASNRIPVTRRGTIGNINVMQNKISGLSDLLANFNIVGVPSHSNLTRSEELTRDGQATYERFKEYMLESGFFPFDRHYTESDFDRNKDHPTFTAIYEYLQEECDSTYVTPYRQSNSRYNCRSSSDYDGHHPYVLKDVPLQQSPYRISRTWQDNRLTWYHHESVSQIWFKGNLRQILRRNSSNSPGGGTMLLRLERWVERALSIRFWLKWNPTDSTWVEEAAIWTNCDDHKQGQVESVGSNYRVSHATAKHDARRLAQQCRELKEQMLADKDHTAFWLELGTLIPLVRMDFINSASDGGPYFQSLCHPLAADFFYDAHRANVVEPIAKSIANEIMRSTVHMEEAQKNNTI